MGFIGDPGKEMKFGKIKMVLLLGGSPLLAQFACYLKATKKYKVAVFTCKRQLTEVIDPPEVTLEDTLMKKKIAYFTSDDICRDKEFTSRIDESTLAIGFGEVWTFDRAAVEKFNGRLLDFMGIPLPQYRGGAHYSWMILRGERKNACNLQLINEHMVQGVFDSGDIVKSRVYDLPKTARIPQDYFDAAGKEEIDFLKEFLAEIEKGKNFPLKKLNEEESVYFPRLYTIKQGWINWAWQSGDIVRFICAFDEPYKGASTIVNGRRVFLKDCRSVKSDGNFHPFQAGLVYRKTGKECFIATAGGGICIGKISDENGTDVMPLLAQGMRLYTPAAQLEESMLFQAVYDQNGIVMKK